MGLDHGDLSPEQPNFRHVVRWTGLCRKVLVPAGVKETSYPCVPAPVFSVDLDHVVQTRHALRWQAIALLLVEVA